jgi:hypothetical protein
MMKDETSVLINCNIMCSYYAVWIFDRNVLWPFVCSVYNSSVWCHEDILFWVRFKRTTLQLHSDLGRLGTLICVGTMETW